MSVSYSDGSVSGTVPAGTRTQVYVPPSSTLSLAASNTAFLTTFKGWSGASNSSGAGTSLVVDGPTIVTSNSEYDYVGIGILALVIALVAIVATVVLGLKRAGQDPTHRRQISSSSLDSGRLVRLSHWM